MFRDRYRRILWFFGRAIMSIILWDIILPRVGFRALSSRTRPGRLRRIAAGFRNLAVRMGGVMVKVGQFLSSRLDVLPREITDELAGLQDEARPETFADIRGVIETEFQEPLDRRFYSFNETPLASASIGQVHAARLLADSGIAGREVVVKVQRPHIEAIVDVDLSALRVVGHWLSLYPPIRRRANVPAMMEEFSRSLMEEMDYLLEGKNGETFGENFRSDPAICVPDVIWTHTTRRVLTMEDIHGIKITDYAAIEAHNISRSEVAERLFNTYLKQIFEDHFFHADPHPGNLFVLPEENPTLFETESPAASSSWRLAFVDFGMTGKVTPAMFDGLREMLIAIGTQDVPRVINSYEKLGILLPGANTELLERAGSRVFERFWGKTTPEMLSMGQEEAASFILEFGRLIYEMPFQVPENLILLIRSLSILSGMCTGLDPNFNIWNNIAPYAEKVLQSEGGGWKLLLGELGTTFTLLLALPRRTDNVLRRLEQGTLQVQDPALREQVSQLNRSINRMVWAVVFAGLTWASVQLYLAGHLVGAGVGGLFAALVILRLLLPF